MRTVPALLWCISLAACQKPGDSIPAYRSREFLSGNRDASESLRGAEITEKFFGENNARPLLGRLFIPEEYQKEDGRGVVISYSLWQRKFAGDPQVIGRIIRLTGENFTIIGVMPESFDVPPKCEMWMPPTTR